MFFMLAMIQDQGTERTVFFTSTFGEVTTQHTFRTLDLRKVLMAPMSPSLTFTLGSFGVRKTFDTALNPLI